MGSNGHPFGVLLQSTVEGVPFTQLKIFPRSAQAMPTSQEVSPEKYSLDDLRLRVDSKYEANLSKWQMAQYYLGSRQCP